MTVNEKAKELAALLMATKEFSELLLAKEIIDRSLALKNKIEEFKRKEKELYSGKISSKDFKLRERELNELFKSLSSIADVSRLLKAEKDFTDLLQGIHKLVDDTLLAKIRSS